MAPSDKTRTAMVTGASYGIGAATAIGLAEDGFDVAVTDLAVDSLASTLGMACIPEELRWRSVQKTGEGSPACGLDRGSPAARPSCRVSASPNIRPCPARRQAC